LTGTGGRFRTNNGRSTRAKIVKEKPEVRKDSALDGRLDKNSVRRYSSGRIGSCETSKESRQVENFSGRLKREEEQRQMDATGQTNLWVAVAISHLRVRGARVDPSSIFTRRTTRCLRAFHSWMRCIAQLKGHQSTGQE
jgi:hypothetical protein